MGLPSIQLDAFLAIARAGSVSAAARQVGLTQSALSQRLLNLEEELGCTLLLRERSGTRPTDAGNTLLRYCTQRESLEAELRVHLAGATGEAAGPLRIGAFSTVLRSLVLPAITRFCHRHPRVVPEFIGAEVRELLPLLESGRVDMVLTTAPSPKTSHECLRLGEEWNVLVEPVGGTDSDYFLDHDTEDTTTRDFFLKQRTAPPPRRLYMDEIYAILDGVRMGLGRAVVPYHLAKSTAGIAIRTEYKPLKVPVYLVAPRHSVPTLLQSRALAWVRDELKRELRTPS